MVSRGKIGLASLAVIAALSGGAAVAYERNDLQSLRNASRQLQDFGMRVTGTTEQERMELGRNVLTTETNGDRLTEYRWDLATHGGLSEIFPPGPCAQARAYDGTDGRRVSLSAFRPGSRQLPPGPCAEARVRADADDTEASVTIFERDPGAPLLPPGPCVTARYTGGGGGAGRSASFEATAPTDPRFPPDPYVNANVRWADADDSDASWELTNPAAVPGTGGLPPGPCVTANVTGVRSASMQASFEVQAVDSADSAFPPGPCVTARYRAGGETGGDVDLAVFNVSEHDGIPVPCVRVERISGRLTVTTEAGTYLLMPDDTLQLMAGEIEPPR